MKPLRILITNSRMAKRTGTELYVYELAIELLERGHRPVVYCPKRGELADALQSRTVPVVDRLDQVGFQPDVIHGHHSHPTLCACLHFADTPAIFVCHAWSSWQDEPPRLPRIRKYLAVDQACRDRLVCVSGVPEADVAIMPNFVNLQRFQKRAPLPEKPQRGLLFTNRASGNYVRALRQACQDRGIQLDLLGSISGQSSACPEAHLGAYDVVFARAKAAMEAMAVGAAVILCDRKGMGPMVAPDNFRKLRRLNFGRRALVRAVTVENVSNELDGYSRDNAQHVCEAIRAEAPLSLTVDRLLGLYRQVIRGHAAAPTSKSDDMLGVANQLEHWKDILDSGWKQNQLRNQIVRWPRRVLSRISASWMRRAG